MLVLYVILVKLENKNLHRDKINTVRVEDGNKRTTVEMRGHNFRIVGSFRLRWRRMMMVKFYCSLSFRSRSRLRYNVPASAESH